MAEIAIPEGEFRAKEKKNEFAILNFEGRRYLLGRDSAEKGGQLENIMRVNSDSVRGGMHMFQVSKITPQEQTQLPSILNEPNLKAASEQGADAFIKRRTLLRV